MPKLKPLLFLFIAITILTMLTNVPSANSQPTSRWESEYETAYSLAQAEAEKQGLLVGELTPISEGSPSFYRYAWHVSFMDNVTGSYAKVSVIRTQYYNIEKKSCICLRSLKRRCFMMNVKCSLQRPVK
jgi:hypothetical protein